ncbi:hypothetical protein SLS59_000642 [Nothophoma quercina]|uniref:Uncharacterized protein n=1 Tax=Nothophoma quercina TaxID=749835 RepID=A0ABR3S2T8_9PLEO
MEDVTFVSSRAVSKRKATDNIETPSVKRHQYVRNNLGIQTTEAVEDAMSAPAPARSAPGARHRVKREADDSDPEDSKRYGGKSKEREKARKREMLIKEMRDQQSTLLKGKKILQDRIKSLERAAERGSRPEPCPRSAADMQARLDALQARVLQDRMPSRDEILKLCENIAKLEHYKHRLEGALASQDKENDNLRAQVKDLTDDIRTQTNIAGATIVELQESAKIAQEEAQELIKVLDEAKRMVEERDTKIRDHDKKIANVRATHAKQLKSEQKTGRGLAKAARVKIVELQEAQKSLEAGVQQRDNEIASLKASRSKWASQQDRRSAREAKEEVEEKNDVLEKRIIKMFEHYDTVQSNNAVLIGKLTKIGLAGGFGGPGTIYRKELDSLKAPPLTELEEYNDRARLPN